MTISRCPECKVKTEGKLRYSGTKEAISWADAKSRQAHANFEEFYWRREGDREPPSPEEEGAEQAQRDIALIRLLNEAWEAA